MTGQRLLRILSFGTLAVIILAMVAATVLEKRYGTPFALRAVYHHPAFIALWAVAALAGLAYLFTRGVGKRVVTGLLHVALAVILAGALVTFLTGEKGELRLRRGQAVSSFVRADGVERALPFSLIIEDFTVAYYPGSSAASDYRTVLTCRDGEEALTATVAMNRIFRHRGYRFYQAGYEPDGTVSILSVSHDPWGIGITYAGYLLLLLSMVAFFFQRGSRFRAVLKRVAAGAFLVLLLIPAPVSARDREELPPVLPEEVAAHVGELYVYYNDRVAPIETMARDYCLKAYGKARWKDRSAVQVVTGWLFYYDWWTAVPFKLKDKDRGTAKEAEKEALRMEVASGRAFKLFPLAFADSLVAAHPGLQPVMWFSCDDPLPEDLDYARWVFVRRTLDLIHEEIRQEDWAEVDRIVGQVARYQRQVAAEVLPSARKVRAEHLYNRICRPMAPFMAAITLGLILFVLGGVLLARGRRHPAWLLHGVAVLVALLWGYLTLVLALRWYVSDHAPFAGSYSVMMLMAWLSALAVLLLYRKFPLVQPLGLLLAGFTMLVASLASANPQITHLMPVLQSPLLSLHVLSMMVSYTLFGLVALNGVMGLLLPCGGPSERLQDISYVVLCPAVFLLAGGIFLGAVWANISWGSYWNWDPKETWALITLLVYAAALHGSSLRAFRRPRFFHAWCVAAFLTVLVTYFGVNLLLGGMHAYA